MLAVGEAYAERQGPSLSQADRALAAIAAVDAHSADLVDVFYKATHKKPEDLFFDVDAGTLTAAGLTAISDAIDPTKRALVEQCLGTTASAFARLYGAGASPRRGWRQLEPFTRIKNSWNIRSASSAVPRTQQQPDEFSAISLIDTSSTFRRTRSGEGKVTQ